MSYLSITCEYNIIWKEKTKRTISNNIIDLPQNTEIAFNILMVKILLFYDYISIECGRPFYSCQNVMFNGKIIYCCLLFFSLLAFGFRFAFGELMGKRKPEETYVVVFESELIALRCGLQNFQTIFSYRILWHLAIRQVIPSWLCSEKTILCYGSFSSSHNFDTKKRTKTKFRMFRQKKMINQKFRIKRQTALNIGTKNNLIEYLLSQRHNISLFIYVYCIMYIMFFSFFLYMSSTFIYRIRPCINKIFLQIKMRQSKINKLSIQKNREKDSSLDQVAIFMSWTW